MKEIDLASELYPGTRRIFLADGDALNLETSRMVEILQHIQNKFKSVERISCYAMPSNLLRKNDDELRQLKQEGLGMFYVGIESGNDVILKKVTKGATGRSIVVACKKAQKIGFVLSCMIILGLGGKRYTTQHIADTARVINEISPDYVGALNLHLDENVRNEFMKKFGEPFYFLDDAEVLDEVERLVSSLAPVSSLIFRANHASNVYSLGGILPAESSKLLTTVREIKSKPHLWKSKVLRGF